MSLPPSSPRLPSPPPPTEIQIGPKSPSIGDSSRAQENYIEQSVLDANANRRIHPGTKAADMAAGPPLIPLMELDSAFQLQEHLKALHYQHTKQDNSTVTIPITRTTAAIIATPPHGVDRSLWLYELCRFLINKCNDIIVGFLFDVPPCSSATCPEMRASEWQFLCAVHESPKSCCAIDYSCHTLDWATNIVTSQTIFPSRLSLNSGDGLDEKGAGVKHLVNIFRRLHRIFAHAWFQHRGVFWQVEGQTGLYVLFKTVCDQYELLPAEIYKLPPEAEGLEQASETKPPISILKSDTFTNTSTSNPTDSDNSSLGVARTNTRRHIRSSPSTGSAVTTVLEADEDDVGVTERLRELRIRETEITPEEGETQDPEAEPPVDNPVEQDVTIIVDEEDLSQNELHPAEGDKPRDLQDIVPEPSSSAPTPSDDQNEGSEETELEGNRSDIPKPTIEADDQSEALESTPKDEANPEEQSVAKEPLHESVDKTGTVDDAS